MTESPASASPPSADTEHPTQRAVFLSHASVERKQTEAVCKALEKSGLACWLANRDVQPGDNYQEAIVRAIREAHAMVLVFSAAANGSDEIKKELSLASRHRIPVVALRIEDVEPTDAFAYELSTRQWIDALEGWDKAMVVLSGRLHNLPTRGEATATPPIVSGRRARPSRVSRPVIAVLALIALLLAGFGTWRYLRPSGDTAQRLVVRLADFKLLGSGLPPAMSDALHDELIAAFGNDGVVRVSTKADPPGGTGPAYSLGGTVRREGDKVKIIAQLVNDRSGVALWSNTYTYDDSDADRIPRMVAVDASMVARCGLFGASTYLPGLSDPVFADYFQACQAGEPDKALDFAHKVVTQQPDFSWGWSMIEIAAFDAIMQRPSEERREALRKEGLAAADKAIELDNSNSEALTYKAQLIDPSERLERERLLRQAIKARVLPCGCEHQFYGDFLMEVGRFNDAVTQYRRSIDIMALNPNSHLSLAQAYIATGRMDLVNEQLAATFELDRNPRFANLVKGSLAPDTGDYASGLRAITDPNNGAPPQIRPALAAAFSALISHSRSGKAKAVALLEAMPERAHGGMYVMLLGALGANNEALDGVAALAAKKQPGAALFLFGKSFAGVRRDPAFNSLLQRLGLIDYWRKSHTRPDMCVAKAKPDFCKLI